MSFSAVLSEHQGRDWDSRLASVTDGEVARALEKETLDEDDFLALLSPRASGRLEAMAEKAKEVTERNFGRVIFLFAPLYLGNYCDNECVYCGFSRPRRLPRKKLSLSELEREAEAVAAAGIRQILILTGESRTETPVSYLKECVRLLTGYFSSIWIEVYPLEREEYEKLIGAGAEGLTIYQETYDETKYAECHRRGPKRDFRYRLDAPERACLAGIRTIGNGALLGLDQAPRDVLFAGLHAAYLQRRHPQVEIGVSFPRLRPLPDGRFSFRRVSDAELVQMMLAVRLFLPRAGITISTREALEFRKNLIGLGVTRMSAGSRTGVGGYAVEPGAPGQFDVADGSGVREVREMIMSKGYQPVMKDWQAL